MSSGTARKREEGAKKSQVLFLICVEHNRNACGEQKWKPQRGRKEK